MKLLSIGAYGYESYQKSNFRRNKFELSNAVHSKNLLASIIYMDVKRFPILL